jgi:ribosomal subunit interface protein
VRVLVDDRTEGLPIQMVDYAERRLERLSRHFDRIAEAEVEFERESGRGSGAGWLVQITVRTDGRRHALAHARERAADARSALDVAQDRVDRQVVKLKEKIKIERKRAAAAGAAHLQAEEALGGEPETEIE